MTYPRGICFFCRAVLLRPGFGARFSLRRNTANDSRRVELASHNTTLVNGIFHCSFSISNSHSLPRQKMPNAVDGLGTRPLPDKKIPIIPERQTSREKKKIDSTNENRNERLGEPFGLATRCFLRRVLPGLHLAKTVLATGTQRSGKTTLLHGSLSRDNGIADLSTVDTGTIGQTRRELLAHACVGSNNFGRCLDTLDDLAVKALVGQHGAGTYICMHT